MLNGENQAPDAPQENQTSAEDEFDQAIEQARAAVKAEPAEENEDEGQEEGEQPAQPVSKHPGDQYLDLAKATPQQIQDRINFLTRQSKTSREDSDLIKREYHQLRDALTVALSELSQIKGRQTKADQADAMATLNAQYREALENQDYDEAARINDLILDAKIEQRQAGVPPKANGQQPAQPQPRAASYEDRFINEMANQTNEKGEYTRSYLRDGDPLNQRAAAETAIMVQEYAGRGQDFRQNMTSFMDELHTRMQQFMPKPAAPGHAPVLSGRGANLVSSAPRASVKLSAEEKRIASKLGLSEEDYRKSKENETKARQMRWG